MATTTSCLALTARGGASAARHRGVLVWLFVLLMSAVGGNLGARVAESARRRACVTRDRERHAALAACAAGRWVLADLTRLVRDIEREAPEQARRVDLEQLLDRHVELTLAHERALHAVGMADRQQLLRIRDAYRVAPGTTTDPRRLELAERRLRCHDDCVAVEEAVATELALVSETIQLIAQRAACPEVPAASELIDRQLAELDDTDAVRRELARLDS